MRFDKMAATNTPGWWLPYVRLEASRKQT